MDKFHLDQRKSHMKNANIMNIGEAKAHFSELIDQAARGTSTIIAKAGTPLAMIVPFSKPKKVVFGWGKGLFSKELMDAIEAPLPDEVLASFYTDNLEP